jgi:phosphoribosylanthranilate isomerase
MFIKICGIDDPEIAKTSLKIGVDFVGIILTHTSKRFLGIERAMQIINAVKSQHSRPVLVFRDESFQCIAAFVEKIGDCIVQFQGGNHPDTKILIETFETMIALSAIEFSRAAFEVTSKTRLVIDSQEPGSGMQFCWNSFKPPCTPWFLAGGLNSDNVSNAIAQLNPTGVDVSTGVESSLGKKDLYLIEEFIEAAKK